jgi:hypothetical protein
MKADATASAIFSGARKVCHTDIVKSRQKTKSCRELHARKLPVSVNEKMDSWPWENLLFIVFPVNAESEAGKKWRISPAALAKNWLSTVVCREIFTYKLVFFKAGYSSKQSGCGLWAACLDIHVIFNLQFIHRAA